MKTKYFTYRTSENYNTDSKRICEYPYRMEVLAMIYEEINYTADGRVKLKTYIPDVYTRKDAPRRPAMIACPGGAWTFLSPTEGEPVALTFLKEGYAAFVLYYSVGDYSEFPNPLVEISWAIKTVRDHADEWHIDPNKIAISGYSAGASVCSMSATQWNNPLIAEKLGAPSEQFKPDAAVLAYCCNDLGTIFDTPTEGLVVPTPGKITADRTPEVDVVNYVTKDTAPIFFYHCRYDEFVPVKNTWMLASKLDELGLPFELHIFGSGHHGMSVNNRLTEANEPIDSSVTQWVPLCISWLDKVFEGR